MQKNYRKNKILYDKQTYDKALDKLLTVNQQAIENKIEREISSIDLNILLTANDKDFSPLLTQYCNKTGTELHGVSVDNLKMLIAVHQRERAILLLKYNACSQYSPLWLHSEPKVLNKLMYFDPQGFFIYAASNIFHCDIISKGNASTPQPMGQAGKESTENGALDNFLADFPQQDKPAMEFIHNDTLESIDIRYFNLQDKIISNRNLQLYHDGQTLTEINELLRRFLGLANPAKVAHLVKFNAEFLYQVTETPEAMETFRLELSEAIKALFKEHFRNITRQKKEAYYLKLQAENATMLNSGAIGEIKSKYGGFSKFHNQPNIRNQNVKESILMDLQGFFDKDTEKNDILKSFKVSGNSKDFKANSIGLDCKTGEKLNRYEPKKGATFTFKVKPKEPKEENKT